MLHMCSAWSLEISSKIDQRWRSTDVGPSYHTYNYSSSQAIKHLPRLITASTHLQLFFESGYQAYSKIDNSEHIPVRFVGIVAII